MPTISVLDSTIAFRDSGAGAPIVFLHGNPQSSHVWRNVIPHLDGEARCLAPDLIGMGRSGKPDIDYSFADHARYLDSWFDALELDGVVLVGIDWGGSLAFDWAARHPERVRGLAFMEAILRPMTWGEFPEGARSHFQALRTPGVGERKALEENFFIEQSLHATVVNGLSDADLAAYAAPYPTPESRRPLLAWPRTWPIDGAPADTAARFEAFRRWLADSHDVPKLLLTFDGSPTLLIGPETAAWCAANVAAIEIEPCGPAGHIAPEDQPDAIGGTLRRWAASLSATAAPSGSRRPGGSSRR